MGLESVEHNKTKHFQQGKLKKNFRNSGGIPLPGQHNQHNTMTVHTIKMTKYTQTGCCEI